MEGTNKSRGSTYGVPLTIEDFIRAVPGVEDDESTQKVCAGILTYVTVRESLTHHFPEMKRLRKSAEVAFDDLKDRVSQAVEEGTVTINWQGPNKSAGTGGPPDVMDKVGEAADRFLIALKAYNDYCRNRFANRATQVRDVPNYRLW